MSSPHEPRSASSTALALAALCLLVPRAAAAGDRLTFEVAPGTKLLKKYVAKHELRIDDMGMQLDDLPYVSDKTGGWVSTTQRIEFLDEYVACAPNNPLEFTRSIRDVLANGKANVARRSGQVLDENSRSSSPLRQQTIRFRWIPEERDWSRCYERIDAEEEWLAPLHGEFELLSLLPPGEVAPGDTWPVDIAAFRHVLAPGGNLQMVPSGGSLFGRLMELGVGGDYADFFQPVGGSIEATYKGRRSLQLAEGDATRELEVAVVSLHVNVASAADRTELYRMAMPEDERRENARLDGVSVEYSLMGDGELLWDLAAGHFHSLELSGQEGFVASIAKTRYDGREEHRVAQISRFSGPLTLSIRCSDGAAADEPGERANPKQGGGRKRK